MSALQRISGIVAGLVCACFPLIFLWTGEVASPRRAGAGVLLCLGLATLVRSLGGARSAGVASGFVMVPVMTGAGVAVATALDSANALLLTPVAVSVWLLAVFGASLRAPRTIVERLARLTNPDLSPPQVRYCRRVTLVWCGVFVTNAIVSGALAWAGQIRWWAAYTGLYSYALVGAVFAGEIMIRWFLFGQESVVSSRLFAGGRRP